MDAERRARIDAIFDEVIDLPEPERTQALIEASGGDAALLGEVRALLAAHERASGILEASPAAPPGLRANDDAPERIGPYRLIGVLGVGGMGVVHHAERDDGQFRQRVAIKLLRAGLDARLAERLLTERQILASLVHPHIARLLDGGVTGDGRPYLVMEYVAGVPIDRYCERMRLSVHERVALFVEVSRAVEHAHRNLVVHRDLKPGNILVTSAGEPKLLDFGIARLLNPLYAPHGAPVTGADQRLITPEYASPEQLRGESWGVSADVWSLGVVLYELLAGTRPFHSDGSLADIVRTVLEQEPAPPSRYLPQLRGDLDAITLKCLRKEPSQRYASAELLAQDLERYLTGMPVLAHHGTRAYHAGKWLRRHRAAAAAAAVVLLALSSGAGFSTRQARLADAERGRAESARATAEAAYAESRDVAGFIVSLFEAPTAGEAGPDAAWTPEELLQRGVTRAERLDGQPLVQARLLESIAEAYANMGRLATADTVARRALELRTRVLGPDDPLVAASLRQVAIIARRRSDYPRADALLRRALAVHAAHEPGSLAEAETLQALMTVAVYRSELEPAVAYQARSLAIRDSLLGPAHRLTLEARVAYARVLRRAARVEEAKRVLRDVLAAAAAPDAPADFDATDPMLLLASLLDDEPHALHEAESLYRQALAMRRRTAGPQHVSLDWPLGGLAAVRARAGDAEEALALIRQAHEIHVRAFGAEHPHTAMSYNGIAGILQLLGRPEEAVPYVERALEGMRSAHGDEHSAVASVLSDLGDLHHRLGHADTAAVLLRDALAMRQATLGTDATLVATDLVRLGRVHTARGDLEAAERYLLRGLSTALRHFDATHPTAVDALDALAAMHAAAGRSTHAEHFRALAGRSRSPGA
jgi:eukaryotic-like serine/threonine-protein kinase